MAGKLFGTTGVRKVYGTDFDVEDALNLGKALGTYLRSGRVLVAQDARTTGEMIADALVAGIMSTGVNVVRAGIVPTPTLAFMTKKGGFEAGVMVTASHNPPEYTGVKFWGPDGMGYTPEQEATLEQLFAERSFKVAEWNQLGTLSSTGSAVSEHIAALLERCDAGLVRSKNFRVVVDPGNGAACVMTPYLLQKLGCKVLSINAQLDGHFPGRRSEPDEESLGDLVAMVKSAGADLGVAHDGDSDRVVFVTESGEVIRGDRIIALLAREAISNSPHKLTVTTVDSSQVLDMTVERSGGKVVRTPVGDIQVAIRIKEEGASFGGEACGVFIFPDFHLAPEPFLTVCRVLELMAKTGKSFGALISEIPVYPLRKTKVACPNERKESVMAHLREELPAGMKQVTKVLTVDGLAVFMRDGWVLVRPSGTEPVIRITCEAQRDENVDHILETAKRLVTAAVKSVS
ncbi:MAG: phosphoglucosamine mutase [Candidatus Thorarchaeota archaeon]|nr:phosphoglucosamine mutase [Candidatus Thorarchaeota archaeon]